MTDQTPYEIGTQAGRAVASWVEISDSATAHTIIVGYHDGDPEILDMQPSPLSGEWAGESITELSDRYDIDLSDDETAQQFEDGYSAGYWQEVLRVARYQQETDQ